jgi:hypothetical protein
MDLHACVTTDECVPFCALVPLCPLCRRRSFRRRTARAHGTRRPGYGMAMAACHGSERRTNGCDAVGVGGEPGVTTPPN